MTVPDPKVAELVEAVAQAIFAYGYRDCSHREMIEEVWPECWPQARSEHLGEARAAMEALQRLGVENHSPSVEIGRVERDLTGETVSGFRVAAYRETHPEHGDKYGHQYSEHWSTPSKHPSVTVERLFTEGQLHAALALAPSPGVQPGEERERIEQIIRLYVKPIIGHGSLGLTNASIKDAADRILAPQPTEPKETDNGR